MEDTREDCSWQDVYKLNGVVLNGDEEFAALDLDEIDTLVIEFASPLKPLMGFEIPELLLSQ